MRLIEATPTNVRQMGNGWCIRFGEEIVGQEIGAVFLLPQAQYYVRFKIVQGETVPMYQPMDKRPLTEEELEHFVQMCAQIS